MYVYDIIIVLRILLTESDRSCAGTLVVVVDWVPYRLPYESGMSSSVVISLSWDGVLHTAIVDLGDDDVAIEVSE